MKYSSLFDFFLQTLTNGKMALSSRTVQKTGVDSARGLRLPTPEAEHLFEHMSVSCF